MRMTRLAYLLSVHSWHRGQPLSDSAGDGGFETYHPPVTG